MRVGVLGGGGGLGQASAAPFEEAVKTRTLARRAESGKGLNGVEREVADTPFGLPARAQRFGEKNLRLREVKTLRRRRPCGREGEGLVASADVSEQLAAGERVREHGDAMAAAAALEELEELRCCAAGRNRRAQLELRRPARPLAGLRDRPAHGLRGVQLAERGDPAGRVGEDPLLGERWAGAAAADGGRPRPVREPDSLRAEGILSRRSG